MAVITLFIIKNLSASGQIYFLPYGGDTNLPSGWENSLLIENDVVENSYFPAGVSSINVDDILVFGNMYQSSIGMILNGCPVILCEARGVVDGYINGLFNDLNLKQSQFTIIANSGTAPSIANLSLNNQSELSINTIGIDPLVNPISINNINIHGSSTLQIFTDNNTDFNNSTMTEIKIYNGQLVLHGDAMNWETLKIKVYGSATIYLASDDIRPEIAMMPDSNLSIAPWNGSSTEPSVLKVGMNTNTVLNVYPNTNVKFLTNSSNNEFLIPAGSFMNIGDNAHVSSDVNYLGGPIVINGTVNLLNNSKLNSSSSISVSGTVNINNSNLTISNAPLIIESGGEININGGDFKILPNANVTIKDGAKLNISDSTSVEIFTNAQLLIEDMGLMTNNNSTASVSTGNSVFVNNNSSSYLMSTSSFPYDLANIENSSINYNALFSHVPTHYSVTGLPAGLIFNTNTGVISGTSTVAATGTLYITAHGSQSTQAVAYDFRDLITADTTSPILTSFSASVATGTYITGQNINIYANFNEHLDNDSTMSVTLNTGAVVTLNLVSGQRLEGVYTITSGQTNSNSLNVQGINSANVKDISLNSGTNYTVPGSNISTAGTIIIDAGVVINTATFNNGNISIGGSGGGYSISQISQYTNSSNDKKIIQDNNLENSKKLEELSISKNNSTTSKNFFSTTTVCVKYIENFIEEGSNKNNKSDIEKLEKFLNTFEGGKLKVNGILEKNDIEAIKKFQNKYKLDILNPWGLNKATGKVNRITLAKINAIVCAKAYGCPYFTDKKDTKSVELNNKRIQNFLNAINTNTNTKIKETGIFDKITKDAIIEFKNKYKKNLTNKANLKSTEWTGSENKYANKFVGCASK